MEELREEFGVKERFGSKLMRSWLKWAGTWNEWKGKMGGENGRGEWLTKRADVLRVEGKKRKGRPRLRWEDCVKRDLARVRGEGRTRARDKGGWRWVVEKTVKREQ